MLPGGDRSPVRRPGGHILEPPWQRWFRRSLIVVAVVSVSAAIYFALGAVRNSRDVSDDDHHLEHVHEHHHHDHEHSEEACPFGDDHEHHHHHHHHDHDDRDLPQYVAEFVDPKTGAKKYVSLAYKAKGVLLLSRFNLRDVIVRKLGVHHPEGESEAARSEHHHPTAFVVLFYSRHNSFSEEFHPKFVQVAEDVEIIWNDLAKPTKVGEGGETRPASSSMDASGETNQDRERRRAAAPLSRLLDDVEEPSQASTAHIVFGQVDVDELQPPASAGEQEQEEEEVRKTGGSVRDFLFNMSHARRLVADTPSIGVFLPGKASATSGVTLLPYTGRWSYSGLVAFLERHMSTSSARGSSSSTQAPGHREWLAAWKQHVASSESTTTANDDGNGVSNSEEDVSRAEGRGTRISPAVFDAGVLSL